LRRAFAPSITTSTPPEQSRLRSARSESSALATAAFSVGPSHRPSGTFWPSSVTPSADDVAAPVELNPVDHERRQVDLLEPAAHQL
jgi:hypothetical protein